MDGICCLLIDSKDVFSWLGDRLVVQWCLDNLRAVRGFEKMFCCATAQLSKQAKQHLADVEHMASTPAVVDRDPIEWAKQFPDLRRALFVRPVMPFLPSGKIEACLEAIRSGHRSLIMPHRTFATAGVLNGKLDSRESVSMLPYVRAYNVRCKKAIDLAPLVEVSSVEAIAVSESEDWHIAEALVMHGTVS